MVAIARYLNVTLIVPELDKTSFWADPRYALLQSILMFLFFLVTGSLNDSLDHSLSSTYLVIVLLATYKTYFVLLLIAVVITGVRKLR